MGTLVTNLAKLLVNSTINFATNPTSLQHLGTTAAVAVTAATGGGIAIPLITGLANAVSANLLSNQIEKVGSFKQLTNWLQKEHPDKVNHDLERLIRQASVRAFKFLDALYTSDLKNDYALWAVYNEKEKKDFLKNIEHFFKSASNDIYREINYITIEKSWIDNPVDLLNQLCDYILLAPEKCVLDSDMKSRIRSFYTENMPYCFHLAFNEELKSDQRGFKAYQIWIFTDLKNHISNIDQNIKKINAAIEDLKNNVEVAPINDLNNLIEQQNEKIYIHLEQKFSAIKETLEQISINIEIIRADVREILSSNRSIEKNVTWLKENYNKSKKINHFINAIPRHTDQFQDREKELLKIRERLTACDGVFLLSGVPGIGKSTLAKVFVKRYESNFQHLVWLEVKTNDRYEQKFEKKDLLYQAFVELQSNLDLLIPPNLTLEDKFKLVTTELQNLPGENLLVIDNVNEDLVFIMDYLPGQPNWKVLATGRSVITGCETYPINNFDEDDAIKLFKKWLKTPVVTEVLKEFLKEISYHTLMIELCAKTLAASDGDLELGTFLEKLQTRHLDDGSLEEIVLTSHLGRNSELMSHLLITFDFSYLNESEVELLKKWHFLAPGPYTLDKLKAWFEIPLADSKEFRKLVKGLVVKGWLTHDEISRSYSIHRLVQEMIFYRLKPDYNDAISLVQTFLKLIAPHHNLSQRLSYAEYVEFLLKQVNSKEDDILKLSYHLGYIYSNSNYFKKAEFYLFQSLEWARKSKTIHVLDEFFIVKLQNLIGVFYSRTSFDMKAEEYYNNALHLLKTSAYNDQIKRSDLTILVLNNLGAHNSTEPNFEKAEYFLEESLRINNIQDPENHEIFTPLLAGTYHNIAVLKIKQGQLVECEEAYLNSLKLYQRPTQKFPNGYRLEIARTWQNMALLFQSQKRFVDAQNAFTNAIEICKLEIEEDPVSFLPMLGLIYDNLGALLFEFGQSQPSLNAFYQSLEIYKSITKKDPSSYADEISIILYRMGKSYLILEEYEKGEEFLILAIEKYKTLSKISYRNYSQFNYLKLIDLYESLSKLYHRQKKYQKTKDLLIEAYQLIKSITFLDKNYQERYLADNRYGMGVLMSELKDHNEAEKYLSRALEYYKTEYQKNPSENSEMYSNILTNLGWVFENTGRDANSIFELCFQVIRQSYDNRGSNSLHTLSSFSGTIGSVARFYYLDKQYKKAIEALTYAVKINSDIIDARPSFWKELVFTCVIWIKAKIELKVKKDPMPYLEKAYLVFYAHYDEASDMGYLEMINDVAEELSIDIDKYIKIKITPQMILQKSEQGN